MMHLKKRGLARAALVALAALALCALVACAQEEGVNLAVQDERCLGGEGERSSAPWRRPIPMPRTPPGRRAT